MIQAKFSLDESQIIFLNHCKSYGFKDRSEMVREALKHLIHELEQRQLEQSAQMYAELYIQDPEISQLTEGALENWPE